MAVYRYFLSNDPSAASPPLEELATVDADSPSAAAAILTTSGQLPANWRSLWAHILVWSSLDGKQLGFQSFRLADHL
jgi:hypothetical protein